MKKNSAACASLCEFAIAMYHYNTAEGDAVPV